jgi:hypothetical protein
MMSAQGMILEESTKEATEAIIMNDIEAAIAANIAAVFAGKRYAYIDIPRLGIAVAVAHEEGCHVQTGPSFEKQDEAVELARSDLRRRGQKHRVRLIYGPGL